MLKENCHSKCNIVMRKRTNKTEPCYYCSFGVGLEKELVMSIAVRIGDTNSLNYFDVSYCPTCGLDINGKPAQPLEGDSKKC